MQPGDGLRLRGSDFAGSNPGTGPAEGCTQHCVRELFQGSAQLSCPGREGPGRQSCGSSTTGVQGEALPAGATLASPRAPGKVERAGWTLTGPLADY